MAVPSNRPISRNKAGSGPRQAVPGKRVFVERDHHSISGLNLSRWLPQALVLASVFLMLVGMLESWRPGGPPNLKPGEESPRMFQAPFALSVPNEEATENLRRLVQERAPKFYLALGEEIAGVQVAALLSLMAKGEELRQQTALSEERRLEELGAWAQRVHGIEFKEQTLRSIMQLGGNEAAVSRLEGLLRRTLVDKFITDSQLEMRTFARQELGHYRRSSEQPIDEAPMLTLADIGQHVVDRANLGRYLRDEIQDRRLFENTGLSAQDLVDILIPLMPNSIKRDPEADVVKRDALLARVEPVMAQFAPGDTVVERGSPATPLQARVLREYAIHLRDLRLLQLIWLALLAGLFMGFVLFYCRRFHREMPMTSANLAALYFPVLMPLACGRLLLSAFPESTLSLYAFPAALAGLLGVILIEARYALLIMGWATILFIQAAGAPPSQTFPVLLAAIMQGGFAVTGSVSLRQRQDALMAGFKGGVAAMVAILAHGYSQSLSSLPWDQAYAGLAGGVLSGVLLYPAIFFLEKVTGITTDLRLMELTSIRHPVIMQLEQRAPGTYQHTLNVMKLAEAAAAAIGANEILVRAGTLFHDIGKMDKPKYFSENQVSAEDRRAHDKLTPHMSALIIKEHVRNGVVKARKAGLPQRIIDFIPEHHGTTVIAYFLHKARKNYEESGSNDPVRPIDFQHVGPKPQSVETAIVLLADSVDAVAGAKLSGGTVNHDEIRRLVRDVINQKFREEQFDECELTLRDLSLIADAFTRTLEGRFHYRVKYPDGKGAPPPGKGGASGRKKAAAGLNLSEMGSSVMGASLSSVGASTGARRPAVVAPPLGDAGPSVAGGESTTSATGTGTGMGGM